VKESVVIIMIPSVSIKNFKVTDIEPPSIAVDCNSINRHSIDASTCGNCLNGFVGDEYDQLSNW